MRDNLGNTPLMYALKRHSHQAVYLLLDHLISNNSLISDI